MKSKPQLRLGSSWERPSSCGAQRSLCRRRRRRRGSRSGGRLLGSSLLCWSLLGAGLLRRRSLLSGRLFYRRSLLRRYSPLRGRRLLSLCRCLFRRCYRLFGRCSLLRWRCLLRRYNLLGRRSRLGCRFRRRSSLLASLFRCRSSLLRSCHDNLLDQVANDTRPILRQGDSPARRLGPTSDLAFTPMNGDASSHENPLCGGLW